MPPADVISIAAVPNHLSITHVLVAVDATEKLLMLESSQSCMARQIAHPSQTTSKPFRSN